MSPLFAYLTQEQEQQRRKSYTKFEQTQAVKRKRSRPVQDDLETPSSGSEMESEELECNPGETRERGDHIYTKDPIHTKTQAAVCPNEGCQTMMKNLQEENEKLRDRARRSGFQQEVFREREDMVQDLTGLPSYAKMMVVFTFLARFLKGGCGLSPFHCYLMTLMRMRLRLPLSLLSHFFLVSTPTVSRIFNSTLNVMYYRLSPLIVWPSKEQIEVSLPMCFKRSGFRNCTSIIDCFEIFIEKPKNYKARSQTYSQYKSHNTVKYLISITPQGTISFVSKGWGGRTSDKHITQNSGYLEKLSAGDVVLADRGFNIGDDVGLFNARLKIPAFTKGKQQLHPSELESTRGLAAVRIHVERCIGFVRNKYTILQSTIPITLCQTPALGDIPTIDKMVTVCCALCNMCPSVVPSE